jgi:hypothetical protein
MRPWPRVRADVRLMNVSACLKLELAQRGKYDLRHMRGRSVVEIVQASVRETAKSALDRSRIEALIQSSQLHLMLPLRCDRPRKIAALTSNGGSDD